MDGGVVPVVVPYPGDIWAAWRNVKGDGPLVVFPLRFYLACLPAGLPVAKSGCFLLVVI